MPVGAFATVSHPPSTVGAVADTGERGSGFAVVDVETTGFSPEDERIVEVGVVVLDSCGHEVGAFCTLVDPGRDPGPTHIHGISAEMLAGAPPFWAIHPFLADQLSGRVVVGHNVDQFDLYFLRAECQRMGGAELVPGVVPSVDTLLVAQHHLGLQGKATLVECCTRSGLTWDDHHSALGDARVTAALFRSMRSELGDDALGIDDLLVRGRRSFWPGASATSPVVRVRTGPVTGRAARPRPTGFPFVPWRRRDGTLRRLGRRRWRAPG
jgi:DNA polymerase III epsilon subunit-like protein